MNHITQAIIVYYQKNSEKKKENNHRSKPVKSLIATKQPQCFIIYLLSLQLNVVPYIIRF